MLGVYLWLYIFLRLESDSRGINETRETSARGRVYKALSGQQSHNPQQARPPIQRECRRDMLFVIRAVILIYFGVTWTVIHMIKN